MAAMNASSLRPDAALLARSPLPGWLQSALLFLLRQVWAGLFAGIILTALLITSALWQDGWALARYDFLVLLAVSVQVLLIATKLETWDEAKVILLFHLTGTVMEWFKVHAGSWAYPEPGVLKLFDVPLFTGFMYASVGSYIARAFRLFGAVIAPYPPFWASVVLAVAIYVNFFAHHWLPDIRLALFAATLLLFWRSRMWFSLRRWHWMPFPLAALLIAFALWVAENIGTASGTWIYHGQGSFELVPLSKMGSWYLLFFVSFTTVTLVMRDSLRRAPFSPGC
ncbi:MAG: DUF817 domain-containing protein [Rhodobacteraceae bacterium]|nr:DUF817 domain-containing protein [Paracoccaceae bacterium]MBR9820475.1 DUF817 domain-containing protein [Paracoccaceae bacterium]